MAKTRKDELSEVIRLFDKVGTMLYNVRQDADAERLVDLVRLQDERIEDMQISVDHLERENQRLERRLGKWSNVNPASIREFLEDIGLDPYNLPTSLGDRLSIRDAICSKTFTTR